MVVRSLHSLGSPSPKPWALGLAWGLGAAAAFGAGKVGDLSDFAKLGDDKNLARRAFANPAFKIDASRLERTNHYSKYSAWFPLQPGSNYTLGVVCRARGASLVSAGVKQRVKGQPPGLADREDHYACWPQAAEWTLRTVTFTSDIGRTDTQIIVKAYGGMAIEIKSVRLVSGWYSDR